MSKILNIIGYIFILLVFALAVLLVVFRLQVFAYLNQINNVTSINSQTDLNASALGIKIDQVKGTGSLDLSVINNDKFKDLQEVKVDLTGLNLPDKNNTSSTSTTAFPVGNKDPFKPF